MTASLRFRVIGDPAPQGSKRHVGNGVMVESSKKVKPWRAEVAAAARDAADAAGWVVPREVALEVTFWFRRPKAHYRTGRNAHLLRDDAPVFHSNKPDCDKLQRALFDAFTTAGVVEDDCRIVEVHARKVWADASLPTGAQIELTRAVPIPVLAVGS